MAGRRRVAVRAWGYTLVHPGCATGTTGGSTCTTPRGCARRRNPGQVLVSESTAGSVDVALEDLGEHALRDFPAARRIFHLPIDERGKDFFPAPRTLQAGQTNLPDQLSSFVGRAADLARLRALAARERLVTLTGPGGVGKTRLGLRLGAELLDGGGDGAWFVDLAPLSDGALVVFQTAEVLGVTARAGQEALDALGERLSTRRLVVVLDNCEHVIQAAREPGRESCSRVVRACSCWRPVASRLGSLASMFIGCRRCRFRRRRSTSSVRWRAQKRCSCSLRGRRSSVPGSPSTVTTRARWLGCVGDWTGSRWLLSWPRCGCVRCQSTIWAPAWIIAWRCSRAPPGRLCRVSRRCWRCSTGPIGCCLNLSA